MRIHDQRRWMATIGGALALLALTAGGCVDPHERYDAFLERSASMRGHDAGTVAPGERFDFSGHYLSALSTTLAPGQSILFACDIEVASDLTALDLTFQPLATDADASPREPVGEPIVARAVAYMEDGSFSADLGEVTVPGRANPISGSDIVASVVIDAAAHAQNDELPVYFCGQASGMVTVPLAFDLAGSTIGAVAADDVSAAQPLPRCPDQ
jgi:hypothetical protein